MFIAVLVGILIVLLLVNIVLIIVLKRLNAELRCLTVESKVTVDYIKIDDSQLLIVTRHPGKEPIKTIARVVPRPKPSEQEHEKKDKIG